MKPNIQPSENKKRILNDPANRDKAFIAPKLKETLDPLSMMNKSQTSIVAMEAHGMIFKIIFGTNRVALFEVFEFVEDSLNLEVEDACLMRDNNQIPTGIAIVQMKEDITSSQTKIMMAKAFKGLPVSIELFEKERDLGIFLHNCAKEKLSNVLLPFPNSVPVVYVQFSGLDPIEVIETLGQCGLILRTINQGSYLMLFYEKENQALAAYRGYNCIVSSDYELIVNICYYKSIDRSFCVRFFEDKAQLLDKIRKFGPIESTKDTKDGAIYILMERFEDSKLACVLLNSTKILNTRIQTCFVHYDSYVSIK